MRANMSSVIRDLFIAASSSCCTGQQVAGEPVVLPPVNGVFRHRPIECPALGKGIAARFGPR